MELNNNIRTGLNNLIVGFVILIIAAIFAYAAIDCNDITLGDFAFWVSSCLMLASIPFFINGFRMINSKEE